MKYLLLSLMLFTSIKMNPSQEAFDKFHQYFEKRDFVKMENLLDDEIIIYAIDTKTTHERDEYFAYLKDWSTTFNTKWNVEKVKTKGDTTYSVEYDTDIYNNFFYGGVHKSKLKYVAKNNKLVYLSWDTTAGNSKRMEIFNARQIAFYKWCLKKHPEKYYDLMKQSKEAYLQIRRMLTEYLAELETKNRVSI
jgi:hypothetical protein